MNENIDEEIRKIILSEYYARLKGCSEIPQMHMYNFPELKEIDNEIIFKNAKFLIDENDMCSVLTTIYTPEYIKVSVLRKKLRDKQIIIYEGKGEFKDKIYWWNISRSQKLSEDFIREFQDKVDWYHIRACQTLSDDFLKEFYDKKNYAKARDYKIETGKISFISTTVSIVITLCFLWFEGFGILSDHIAVDYSFPFLQTAIFFFVLFIFNTIIYYFKLFMIGHTNKGSIKFI